MFRASFSLKYELKGEKYCSSCLTDDKYEVDGGRFKGKSGLAG